jgi:hypothetical protein
MGLPTSYLTTTKNVEAILSAIQGAQAPERFTQKFLESLGFTSSSDRLMIPVLKSLGFITGDGAPTQRYYDFLDQTQAGRVLADALKTLTQGKRSDDVLEDMANTFKKFAAMADWSTPTKEPAEKPREQAAEGVSKPPATEVREHPVVRLEHLAYNIQLILPESRDPAVYDAIFKSLKEHLLK